MVQGFESSMYLYYILQLGDLERVYYTDIAFELGHVSCYCNVTPDKLLPGLQKPAPVMRSMHTSCNDILVSLVQPLSG